MKVKLKENLKHQEVFAKASSILSAKTAQIYKRSVSK